MIYWLLFDFFLYGSNNFIPCFFLIGLAKERKINFFAIFSFFLLYDCLIYQSYGKITLIIILLQVLKKYLPKSSFVKFNLIVILFLSSLIILNQVSFSLLISQKVLITMLLLNLFYSFVK